MVWRLVLSVLVLSAGFEGYLGPNEGWAFQAAMSGELMAEELKWLRSATVCLRAGGMAPRGPMGACGMLEANPHPAVEERRALR